MSRISSLTSGVFLFSCAVTAHAADFNIDRLQRVDDMAREYVDGGLLPGVMWGVVSADKVIHRSVVGEYHAEDLFRIYSMTKPVTVVAVLMLMERGQLLLTDPVSRYLPEFASIKVRQDGSDRPVIRPLTLRHLLTHTGGVSDESYPGELSKLYEAAKLDEADSLADFAGRVAALPLFDDPGAAWRYGVGFDLLARVVEVISGQPFDRFLADHIFQPLGMTDTGFYVRPGRRDRLVPLYVYEDGGMSRAPVQMDWRNFKKGYAKGGSGLVTTLSDYLAFVRMLLGDGALDGVRLLSPKTIELMMADHLLAINPVLAPDEPWLANTENRSGSTQLGFGFGLGGWVMRDVSANAVPGSRGIYAWGGTGNTFFFVDRSEDAGGVFFTQLRPSGNYPLRAQFRTMIYQAME